MPHDECKDIEGVDEVGAAHGEIVDPRLSKIASNRPMPMAAFPEKWACFPLGIGDT
jgi:hypothetical protein